LFHPLAIHEIIRRAIENDLYTEKNVFFHNERWHCFDAHSDVSAENHQDLLQNLNQKLSDLKTQIKSASHILITYGTAWVYREKASQKIVANCHKIPQSQFEKELLPVASIEKAIQETVALIRHVNPKANIIFTISPVRHLKDGFVENQRSKSHLIAAIHQIINYQLSIVNYFPSYEIMMDELRDYRFYAEDLLHPNDTAIQYIWEQFVFSSISSECLPLMEEIGNIQKALAHKPFNPDSESHRKFLLQLEQKITKIQQQLPQITF
jgi:lysophospholipase L1-like esterase